MKLTSCILILFFYVEVSFSQTYIYKHFGVDEGLPSSEVYDVYQDKKGYMWFATDKGLSRYNGYEFENFTTKNGLPDNTILDFYPQKNGQIWCYGYHSQKLFYFEEEFNGFKNYRYNNLLKEQLVPNATVKSLFLDENQNVKIAGYAMSGYIEISKEGKLVKKYPLNTIKKSAEINMGVIPNTNAFFLLYHNYKSGKDIKVVDIKNPASSRIAYSKLNDKHSVLIDVKLGITSGKGNVTYYETEQYPIGIKKVADSTFFVGYYSNGAEIRDINGEILETFLPNKSVSSFFIDSEGGIWFTTTDDGVFYVKNPNVKLFTNKHIVSLVKDNENKLYAGFNNGDIACLDKENIKILHKGLTTDNAIVQFNSTTNKLYAYSDNRLTDYTSPKRSFRMNINNIPEQVANPLLGSGNDRYYKLENDNAIKYKSKYKVQDVCNFNDTTFIGTSAGLYIRNKDSITKYQPVKMFKSRIDDIDVNLSTNKLFMATQGSGVIVYGKEGVYNITKNDGLTNNIISEIYIENDSTIWACSNTGLNRIVFSSHKKYKVETITKEDGLISNDINDIEIINNTVWVATKKGLCYFEKKLLEEKTDAKILSLKLEDATANKLVINDSRILKYNQNSVDFKLQAVSHKNTNKIKYLYRLKELDTTWVVTTNRVISFPNLSSGNYTFQAKASVLDKASTDLINYNFKILPPFWKSWWFYTICSFFLLGLLYVFFKIRVLTYNQDVFRELIRLAIKRLKRKEQLYKFRSNGEDFKIPTREIQYVNSQGNYLDIFTDKKIYTIRCKIGDFISTTPDALEYLRLHRSYIVRIDQVSSKGRNWVVVKEKKIPVGETYLKELEKIQF